MSVHRDAASSAVYALTGVRIFDGEELVDADTVVLADGVIATIGDAPPPEAEVIDSQGGTLLPGLIDAHVHTSEDGLRQALRFGITTELEMGGPPRFAEMRERIAADDTMADLRSAGPPITAPCGHPNTLMIGREKLMMPECGCNHAAQIVPGVVSVADVPGAVELRVQQGSDWIKVIAENGMVFAEPGQPALSHRMLAAAVAVSHRLNKMVVAHALTHEATLAVVRAGVDGLAHIFVDRPYTPEVIEAITAADAFAIPCLVLNRAIIGFTGQDLASDPRVSARLDVDRLGALRGTFATYPQGDFGSVLATVDAIHAAGVPLIAGTDSFGQLHRGHGGVTEGASLHQELQLLVAAGLTPLEALSAATAVPADVFGLTDRGRIRVGMRADLLLVNGDPTTEISDTLSIRDVWRRGMRATHVPA